MPIQFILIAVILLIIIRLIWQLKEKTINRVAFSGWLLLWLGAIAIIWRPGITSFLANKVGIARGADLVIYSSIILIFYLMFRLLVRIEKIDQDITKIIRRAALKDEKKDE